MFTYGYISLALSGDIATLMSLLGTTTRLPSEESMSLVLLCFHVPLIKVLQHLSILIQLGVSLIKVLHSLAILLQLDVSLIKVLHNLAISLLNM
jgi:hypothetical protein